MRILILVFKFICLWTHTLCRT